MLCHRLLAIGIEWNRIIVRPDGVGVRRRWVLRRCSTSEASVEVGLS